ncbi:MAG: T9SS type A sorting domain-containing protein [Sphingobacteriaceae bacterium]|nr:T9SS type A sorting domain-containing protein [Sphingobacteriaceae bacterium]
MKKIYAFVVLSLAFTSLNAFDKKPNISLNKNSEISFTENKGQVGDQFFNPRPDVKFSGTANGMVFHIRNNGVSYQLHKVESWKAENEEMPQELNDAPQIPNEVTVYRIDEYWKNCNLNFTSITEKVLPGYNNYYTAVCPNGVTNVLSFEGVILKNLYNNIDLHYYQSKGNLKHDYLVAANADYTQIQIEVKGAEVSIQKDGSVLLKTPLGNVEEGAPVVYQNGKKIQANWVLRNGVLSYNIPKYDKNLPLIIDPLVRSWGTYYGGSGVDYQRDLDAEANGNVFIGGYTNTSFGTGIATVGSHQSSFGGSSYDAYLAKFNQAGVRQWGTYYGGTALDYGQGCAVDGSGNSFLSGYTGSFNNMSTPGAHQSAFGGSSYDGFIVKFNSAGVRQWGTYYGGTGLDYGQGCSADAAGNAYFTGYTTSSNNMTTAGVQQPTFGGSSYDAFLVKFTSAGTRIFGTYMGGTGLDYGQDVTANGSGNAYITGYTSSGNNVSSAGAHQVSSGGGYDAYLVKYNTNGTRAWGTYYGGSSTDYGFGVQANTAGDVVIGGYTASFNNISSPGSHQVSNGGGADSWVAKFNTNGIRQWGTYYGGTSTDYGTKAYIATNGNVYISGYTGSQTGTVIATNDGWQTTFGGSSYDAFFGEFNSTGTRLYGTYYGGTSLDYGYGIAAVSNSVYLGGYTQSTGNISSPGSHQPTGNGSYDGFLVKFEQCTAPSAPINTTPPANHTICANNSTTLTASGTATLTWYATPTSTAVLGTGSSYTTPVLTAGSYSYYVASVTCAGGPRALITVSVNPAPVVSVTSGTSCPNTSFNINPTGAIAYTFNPAGGPIYSPSVTTSYTVIGVDGNGCVSQPTTALITVIPSPTITVNSGSICLGQTFTMVPSGALNYTYSSGSATVNPVTTSTYYVTGDSGGCPSINAAVSVVTVQSLPSVTVTGPNAMCLGQTIVLNAFGANTYSWSNGAVTSSVAVSPTASIAYTVVGTGVNTCAGPDVVKNVLVNPNPNVNISVASTVICRGEEVLLTGNAADTYSWNTGALTPTLLVTPSVSISYSVTGTNTTTGCMGNAAITIQVNLCTGVDDPSNLVLNFGLYPNPNHGEFIIESPDDGELIIYNAIGEHVFNSAIKTGKNNIRINQFANGVYFARVTYGDAVKVIRIIKD